jgi:UDP-glucose 4-epimerase
MDILVTGAAGFIGSHTCLVLLEAGHNLVALDNFQNSSRESLKRVRKLAGPGGLLQLVEGDIRNIVDLNLAFAALGSGRKFDAVVHFAGLKAVSESVTNPLAYWDVNLNGSRHLLTAMRAHGCQTLVFSSSATVYGLTEQVPIPETASVHPVNPYGQTKAAVEQMLADVAASEPGWRIACLRYFNPAGAHPSGKIGESPNDIPSNLFPLVSQVAVGRRRHLKVFGGDWPTCDGTGVRDYIHVMDLAEAHKAALDVMMVEHPQLLTLNLGTGQGYSVLQLLAAFEQASGLPVPYVVVARRLGDTAMAVADPSLAAQRLGWRAKRSLAEICRDGWSWQMANPSGYLGCR